MSDLIVLDGKIDHMNTKAQYNRDNPFKAILKERRLLSKPDSTKETFHLVLSIKDSDIKYEVGDSIAVLPKNDVKVVDKLLSLLKKTGEEIVIDKKGMAYPFKEFLITTVNLKGISKKLLQEVAKRSLSSHREKLESLLKEENKVELKNFQETNELIDLFLMFPEVDFSPQEFSELTMPLLPRFYSIASSQSYLKEEVHLLVSCLQYELRGEIRYGACTHYLCHLASTNTPEVNIYLQPSHDFHLTEEREAPLIMVGPGTGLAPFRGFIQERVFHGHPGKNWLIFGERSASSDFYYKEELLEWEEKGIIKLSTAFSRDQEHKIYVQHKMLESGKELFQWLLEGAFFYVCGDLHHMAKDVDAALHKIVEEHGKLSDEEAKDFVKTLKKQKRYLRDVY